jgi:hypothetical protein
MRRINSRVSSLPALVILLGALLLIATFLTAPGHMSAATSRPVSTPAVQITPNRGPYGTETVVTGQGFAPHEQVAIYKETRPFFAYNTDSGGNFVGAQHPLIGPGPASGVITITATGRTSGLKATCIFTVAQ